MVRKTSSEALNERLQALVNPGGPGITIQGSGTFRVGDPVMQTENRKECANGDVGRVVKVDDIGLTVQFTDCTVRYSREDLSSRQLVLAYAISIHKSQGSEYKSVITVILKEHGVMLKRNLLYTAVTRAKKNCFLVCEPEAVKTAIAHEAGSERKTFLAEMLQIEAARTR